MTASVVTWNREMEPLGDAVVAIGVFDGVHKGHQQLLRASVKEARRLRAISVALTFDRDPDQVVTPEAAAPQLLTLADKCAFIAATGVQRVLVVPFTPEIAATPAERFLEEILGACCTVRALHVGEDFRFGARAAGDIDTLYVWAAEHGAEVRGHSLLEMGGAPVTSTRIRALVSHGDVAAAGELLGRPTRVTGTVHRGRGQGRSLGYPTANVVPVPHAALPADGVYAGRVVLGGGTVWPAATSVGLPPSFPEARDYLEAHLIGYTGDLYGQTVTLEFIERIREQRSFDTLENLIEAIAADVERASGIDRTGFAAVASGLDELEPTLRTFLAWAFNHILPASELEDDVMEDGTPVIADPAALRQAQAAVNATEPEASYDDVDDWIELVGPRRLSGIYANAGFSAAMVTAPLQAADIPYRWDPYPPESMPSFRPAYGAFDRSFSLLVPASRRREAEEAMGGVIAAVPHVDAQASAGTGGLDARAAVPGEEEPAYRSVPAWATWAVLGLMLVMWVLRGWDIW